MNGQPYRSANSSITWSHCQVRTRSAAASQAPSIVQLTQTTVSRRAHSPARAAAMASSSSVRPSRTCPAPTSRPPRSDSADTSRSASPVSRATLRARLISSVATWKSSAAYPGVSQKVPRIGPESKSGRTRCARVNQPDPAASLPKFTQ